MTNEADVSEEAKAVKPSIIRKVPPPNRVPYWEREGPVEVRTARLSFRYFSRAGKLQVSAIRRDSLTGKLMVTKTVVLDQDDIQDHPAAWQLLEEVVQSWKPT